MNKFYFDTIEKMEQASVDPEYILGWQGGCLGHPQREEQRVTEAYAAGYEDGQSKNADNFEKWKQ